MTFPRLATALVLALAGADAAQAAETHFQVILFGSVLGTMTFATDDSDHNRPALIRTDLDNTPLGVFDGIWEATSRPVRTEAGDLVTQYLGITHSTRKNRTVSVLEKDGRAIQTDVDPLDEATELSQVDLVPAGILNPVEAFGRVMATSSCPEPLRIYDGRRVGEMTTTGSEMTDGRLVCHMDYEVTAGPGILSPLRFTSFGVDLTYELSAGAPPALAEADVSASIFTVRLVR